MVSMIGYLLDSVFSLLGAFGWMRSHPLQTISVDNAETNELLGTYVLHARDHVMPDTRFPRFAVWKQITLQDGSDSCI